MAASLKSRLARLKERSGAGETPTLRPAPSGSVSAGPPAFLTGWEGIADFVYRRRLFFPFVLPERFDPRPFVARLDRGLLRGASGASSESHTEAATRDLRFFDFETTGLSGGAGTIAFLSAMGRFEEGGLSVEQLFLADYPGEAAFVRSFVESLGEAPILVSYNGASFDWPLIRSRSVMNGLARPEATLHIDLLRSARRLWRPIVGSASLGDLEGPVLGKARGEDIGGGEIPSVYFSFLERGDDERLALVLNHNAEDVSSLAALFAKARNLFAEPGLLASPGEVDLFNLGRILRSCGRETEAESILWRAAEGGDARAALLLARLLRRASRGAEASTALALAGDGFEASIEAARIAEHVAGDLGAALDAAMAAEGKARNEEERRRAQARERRLSLKVSGASRGRPGRTRS